MKHPAGKNAGRAGSHPKARTAKFRDSRNSATRQADHSMAVGAARAKRGGNVVEELRALRTRNQEIEEVHRQDARTVVIEAYDLALRLMEHNDVWVEFIEHELWGRRFFPRRPKPRHQSEPFKWVAQFVARGVSPSSRQQASKLRRVLEFLATKQVHPSKAKDCLRLNGGIEKIYENSRKKQQNPASAAVASDAAASRDEPDDEKPALMSGAKTGTVKSSEASELAQSDPPPSPGTPTRVVNLGRLVRLIRKKAGGLGRKQRIAFKIERSDTGGPASFEFTVSKF